MRRRIPHSTILILILFSFHFSIAQRFGGNPSRTKWKQIQTDTVRIVFPEEMQQQAQRVAAIVHMLQAAPHQNLGDTIRKVSIVLQNRAMISNGYVGLAPYRSEFYTTAPQDAFRLGATNWMDVLAVHEFRHVQQYSNFNKGLSRLASFILGEEGQAVANAAAIPDWFFEGDAVFNETKFTRQGRGKLPFFFSGYQSLEQQGHQFSYMKMRNGSLRHYVPDHYNLGYLLVAYGRKQYGDDIWRKVTEDAARFKPLFYPFQGALKKHTGTGFIQFVQNARQFYAQQWKIADTAAPVWITGTAKNNVINYRYPYSTADGGLIVLKDSYNSIPTFYKLHANGSEQQIAVRDIAVDDYFSYNNGKLIYTAYQPDLRWGNQADHSIRVLDLASGGVQQLAGRTRLFSPDIAHAGNSVVAVDVDIVQGSRMVRMDMNGRITDTIATTNGIFSYPKFSKNDNHVFTAIRAADGRMGIARYRLDDAGEGKPEWLLPLSNRIIGYLQVQGDTLLFSATYEARDELWALVGGAVPKGPYRLASYSTGLYQGTLKADGSVVSAAFTANGYRLASFKPLWQLVKQKDELEPLYVPQAYTSKGFDFADSVSLRAYPVSRYAKSFRLLNIHSWRPYYDRPEYSFTLYGENILNTLRSEIAYTYHETEGSHQLGYSGIFGGSYLQPVFGINQTWQRSAQLNRDTIVHWKELTAYAGLRLPLNLTSGKQYRQLTLQATLHREQVRWTGIGKRLLSDADFNYVEARLSYAGQIQQALQHIYPRWGQTLLVQYRSIINKYTASQLLLSGSLYLPGMARNHNLVLTGSMQHRDTMRQYLFKDHFPFSRGYQAVNFPRMWKLGVNYHFPIAYPDWGFGQIVYFLRVRANAFYDFTRTRSLRTGRRFNFGTLGGELFFDTRWWNQQPVNFGLRYSHLLDQQFSRNGGQGYWEFILPVALFR